tara:strand:+ start:494 stop:742 length:249 start_codon:yes stop_codon:yes gene_type:complete
MRYRVEGVQTPSIHGEMHTTSATVYEWYQDAESHLDAAARFLLDHPEVNNSPVLVVNEEYVMGNYPLEVVRWKADHLCGLRW